MVTNTQSPSATDPKQVYIASQVKTPSPYTPDMVNSAYRNVLGRDADPEGLRHYTAGSEFWGKTPQELEADLRNSQEYRSLISSKASGSATATPVAPKRNPLYDQRDAQRKSLLTAMQPSAERSLYEKQLLDATKQISSTRLGAQAGLDKVENQAIPMEPIIGQQRVIAQQADRQLATQTEAARSIADALKLQTDRDALMADQAKLALQFTEQDLEPIQLGNQILQRNSDTGELEVIYEAPSEADLTADIKEYQYLVGQGYQGSLLDYQREKALLDPSNYQVTTDPFGNQTVTSKVPQTGQLNPSGGMRTDRHNNPAAFTTDIAKQAGLVEGVDYTRGDAFPNNPNLFTARLLGDPVATTIKVIDKIGFYTQGGKPRWSYLAQIPEHKNWGNLSYDQKANIIAQMYKREGGNGSLTVGGGAPTQGSGIAQQYNFYKANPQSFNDLSTEAKTALNSYAAQSGLPAIGQGASPYQAERVQRTLDNINNVRSQVSWQTVGPGSLFGILPGTPAANFKAQLEGLKSAIAFGELTAMREASKTGGALGSVSDKELTLLESALGSLSTNQSPTAFLNSLKQIEDSLNRWKGVSGTSSGSTSKYLL